MSSWTEARHGRGIATPPIGAPASIKFSRVWGDSFFFENDSNLAGAAAPRITRLHGGTVYGRLGPAHLIVGLFIAMSGGVDALLAQNNPAELDPKEVEAKTKTVERLGEQLPLDIEFRDALGKPVTLAEFVRGDLPVILTPVYYRCPSLCNLVLNGLKDAVNQEEFVLGEHYRIVSYSINPKEGPSVAKEKAENYFKALSAARTKKSKFSAESDPKNSFSADGDLKNSLHNSWVFLTGTETSIRRLSDAIGFGWLQQGDEFAHKAVLVFLAPNGKISRYFFGVDFPPRDFHLALADAGNGKVGGIVEQFMLTCFRYDSAAGRYTPYVWGIVRVIMVFVAAGILFMVWRLRRSERVA